MRRPFGTLGSVDLGKQIQQLTQPANKTPGTVPQPLITGYLGSVHHFEVAGVNYTCAIIKVHRTAKQIRDREPEYRELRDLSTVEVEAAE